MINTPGSDKRSVSGSPRNPLEVFEKQCPYERQHEWATAPATTDVCSALRDC
jgi:hypothetical protein